MQFEELSEKLIAQKDNVAYFVSVEDGKSITDTICAIANSGGGQLIFGMDNPPLKNGVWQFSGVGVRGDRETISKIESYARSLIPAVNVTVERIQHEDKVILVASVPDKKKAPISTPDRRVLHRFFGQTSKHDEIEHFDEEQLPRLSEGLANMRKAFADGDEAALSFAAATLSDNLSPGSPSSPSFDKLFNDVFGEAEERTDISGIVQDIEPHNSETVECFGGFADRDKVLETISAFANSDGGKIYVGVIEQGIQAREALESSTDSVIGISKLELYSLWLSFRDAFNPPIVFNALLKSFTRNNKKRFVIVLQIPVVSAGTVVLRETRVGYRRIGMSNVPLASSETVLAQGRSESGPTKIILNRSPVVVEDLSADGLENTPNRLSDSVEVDPEPLVIPVRFGSQLQICREAHASEESLNCDKHANVLAAFFTTTVGDVCFGLFGHWGRGKTFLINKVSQILRLSSGYSVVRFSAWKYRSTPEVWAHLYETIATASRADDFMMKLVAPYRSMLARYGIWPITFSFFAFGFSLSTVNDKLWIGQVALQLLGITGVAYFLILLLRLQGFIDSQSGSFVKHASHREKLGLQAAVGDDLRALIVGWVPMDYWLPFGSISPDITRSEWLASTLKQCWKNRSDLLRNSVFVSAYILAVAFVFVQFSRTLNIPFYGKQDSELPQSFVHLVYMAWGLFALLLPAIAFLMWQGPRRLLMVVDDLDRCEPVQMLEIIESIMLLLDDEEIRRRLQIVMLVEEEALHAALLKKYDHLRLKKTVISQFDSPTDSRIIRENVEKIFVSYLRLPEIPSDDFRDLVSKYLHASDGEPEPVDAEDVRISSSSIELVRNTSKNGITNLSNSDPDESQLVRSNKDISGENSLPELASSGPQLRKKSRIEYAANLKLSGLERSLLQERIETLRASERTDIRWGPRTVRCYIHKYRLARALWIELKPNTEFDVEALLDALIPLQSPHTERSDYLLKYIVEQVS